MLIEKNSYLKFRLFCGDISIYRLVFKYQTSWKFSFEVVECNVIQYYAGVVMFFRFI